MSPCSVLGPGRAGAHHYVAIWRRDAANTMCPMTASRATSQLPAATTDQPSGLLARMVPPMPGSTLWGWLGPLLVTVFGALLRFNR